jgi:hypothetical protein
VGGVTLHETILPIISHNEYFQAILYFGTEQGLKLLVGGKDKVGFVIFSQQ